MGWSPLWPPTPMTFSEALCCSGAFRLTPDGSGSFAWGDHGNLSSPTPPQSHLQEIRNNWRGFMVPMIVPFINPLTRPYIFPARASIGREGVPLVSHAESFLHLPRLEVLALQPENGKDRGWKSTKSVTEEMKNHQLPTIVTSGFHQNDQPKIAFCYLKTTFGAPWCLFFCFLVKCSPQKLSAFFCFVQISQPQKKKSQPKIQPTSTNQPNEPTGRKTTVFPTNDNDDSTAPYNRSTDLGTWRPGPPGDSSGFVIRDPTSSPNVGGHSLQPFFRGSLNQPKLT